MNSELREFWEEKTKKVIKQTERKFAQSLLAEGSLSYEKIADVTGLTVEEVKELATQRTA